MGQIPSWCAFQERRRTARQGCSVGGHLHVLKVKGVVVVVVVVVAVVVVVEVQHLKGVELLSSSTFVEVRGNEIVSGDCDCDAQGRSRPLVALQWGALSDQNPR